MDKTFYLNEITKLTDKKNKLEEEKKTLEEEHKLLEQKIKSLDTKICYKKIYIGNYKKLINYEKIIENLQKMEGFN
jgi:peptidoglycan hydrolase CwlO-like protein